MYIDEINLKTTKFLEDNDMAKFGAYKPGGMSGGMGGGMPNMQNLMKQAQKMQEDMARAKEEIAEAEMEGVAGGGAVKLVLNGNKELISISLDPEVVDKDDVEMLEDLIMVAFNEANNKVDEFVEETMPQGTNGLI